MIKVIKGEGQETDNAVGDVEPVFERWTRWRSAVADAVRQTDPEHQHRRFPLLVSFSGTGAAICCLR